jgi:MFS family permease
MVKLVVYLDPINQNLHRSLAFRAMSILNAIFTMPKEDYVLKDYEGIARKITRTLFLSQGVVSAALITTGTVNSIAGAELSGVIAWAGLPATVLLISAALGALTWGLLMERIGRRGGLAIGLVIGALGAFSAGTAIWRESFPLFLVGMAMFGFAQSAMQLGRFAAAEVNPSEKRGRAIANVVLGGTVGSIVGPLLVGPAGVLATRAGIDELVGPYGTGLVLFLIAAMIALTWLRPDPLEVAKELALQDQATNRKTESLRAISEILRQPGVLVAIISMVIGQVVMVMVMVITSLHMKALEHSLSDISLVISSHTFGMFAFSIFSGRLVDRIGREPVIMLGSVILIIAGLSAGLSSDVLPIAIALYLLGLGWNLCYVGGSTLLTDQLSTAEQSRMQGVNDLFVGFASAIGSLGSGFVFAAVGYQIMGIVGAAFAILPLAFALWWTRNPTRLSPA